MGGILEVEMEVEMVNKIYQNVKVANSNYNISHIIIIISSEFAYTFFYIKLSVLFCSFFCGYYLF